MNILYISYWSIEDGLSEATVKPHLEILNKYENINSIKFVSIERDNKKVKFNWNLGKIEHIPFYSPKKPFLLDKLNDFTIIPNTLIKVCQENNINKIICRSSLAGAIGYLIWKKTKISYYVESFEPHAQYMLLNKVWKRIDVRFLIQSYLEQKQKKTASMLIPVSENYRKHLLNEEGVTKPIKVIPCSVNLNQFAFSWDSRKIYREKFKISVESITGIYVGKFGDMYYDQEAFNYFKSCFNSVQDFFLIILSTNAVSMIHQRLTENNIPLTRVWVGKVRHDKVFKYLSAADFAFNLHKNHRYSMAFSPIKNAEYWANGLPIIISKQIGDDSNIISKNKIGLVVNYQKNIKQEHTSFLINLVKELNKNRNNNTATVTAHNYRSISIADSVYQNLINAT